jgi:hypothetical protein
MNYKKMFALSCWFLGACFSVSAADPQSVLWVDVKTGRAEAAGTQDDPFKAIQQAVDAAPKGACIKVRPGDYKEGYQEEDNSRNRVVVKTYGLTIESTDGPEVTRILGEHDTSAEAVHGMGDHAVRCVYVGSGQKLLLKGFTLANGATRYVKNASGGAQDCSENRAGAVYNAGQVNTNTFTLVDCILTNNVGTRGGAILGGRAIRCRFLDNHASNFGHAARQSRLYHCLFARNAPPPGVTTASGVIAWGEGIYNCTIVDNDATAIAQTFQPICNSVIIGNDNPTDSNTLKTLFTNCVVQSSIASLIPPENNCRSGTFTEFFSPATRDYRLSTEAVSRGAADRSLLPADPEPWFSFDADGQPIPADGALHCGAYQTCVAARARLLLNMVSGTTGTLYINGQALSTHTGTFAATETLPAVLHIDYVCRNPDTTGVYAFQCGSQRVFPTWAGDAALAFQDGADLDVTVKTASKFWVDQATGRDDDAVTGTKDDPYASIQYALDQTKAKAETRVVCVRPGDYKTGGGTVRWNAKNRVVMLSELGHVRLVSEKGRDFTTIFGAADPDSPSGDGRGENAMRCLARYENHCVSGFTWKGGCGGYTADDKDADKLRGGGVCANSVACVITDCLITDCCASRGAAAWNGHFERCIFTGNKVANNGMVRTAELVACLSYGNFIKGDKSFGQDSAMWQCTVADEKGASGTSPAAITDWTTAAVGLVLGKVENGCSVPKKATYTESQMVESVVMAADASSVFQSRTVFREDPYFADDGSYRVCGAGRAAGLLSYENIRSWRDVYGVRYELDENGKTVAGAVATVAPGVVAMSNFENGVSPAGLIKPADESGTVTFTATLDQLNKRACLGFLVNGDWKPATDGTFTLATDLTQPVRVMPLYATNFYVNA